MRMLNPYELNRVYEKDDRVFRDDPTAKSMRRNLSRVIDDSLSYYEESDATPINFFTVPLPNDDEIDYQYLMNFLFFEAKDHEYQCLRRFGQFFEDIFTKSDWSILDRVFNLFVYPFTGSMSWSYFILSKPFSILNFFMNLPFVIFNFINVKENYPTSMATRREGVKALSENFKLIFTGSFDSSSIESLMNRYYQTYPTYFADRMIKMLQSLYSMKYQKLDHIYEVDSVDYFKKVLETIGDFVSQTSGATFETRRNVGKNVKVIDYIGNHKNKNETFLIEPDLVYKEGQAKVIIEMKRPPLFNNFRVPEFPQMMNHLLECSIPGRSVTEKEGERIVEILKQLLVYMVGFECMRGILSDGYTVILVEIDESHLGPKHPRKKNITGIPLKLTTLDCKSSNPSYLQGILYFLMKEILEPITLDKKLVQLTVNLRTREAAFTKYKQGQTSKNQHINTNSDNEPQSKRQRGNEDSFNDSCDSASYMLGSLTAPSSAGSNEPAITTFKQSCSIPPLFISWEDEPEVLQNVFDYLSHVVKIKAKFVKSYILEAINDDDDVVVKIFDPNLTTIKKSDKRDTIAFINNSYRHEKKSAEILTRSNVNTLYLKQVYGEAIYNYGFGPLIKGKFIVSRYLAPGKLPITNDVFALAREQLTKIHEAGIIHGDIRDANMLFDQQNHKLYFIDFGSSSTYGENDSYFSYINDNDSDDSNDSNDSDDSNDSNDSNDGDDIEGKGSYEIFNDKSATDNAHLNSIFRD